MKRTIVIDTEPAENFAKKYWVYALLLLIIILGAIWLSSRTGKLNDNIRKLEAENVALQKRDSALSSKLEILKQDRTVIQQEKEILKTEILTLQKERDKLKKEKDVKKALIYDYSIKQLEQFFADHYRERYNKGQD